jgi:hypothetical protein
MTWRRRLLRRLLWAGVLLGLVLLLIVVSGLRVGVRGRDLLTGNASRLGPRVLARKEGTMTRTLTLIVGIAIAASAFAPAALGEGRLAPLYPPSQVTTYREPIGHPPPRASMLDLANAAGGLRIHTLGKGLASYGDAAERAVPISATGGTTVATGSVDSGRDIDWPQVGIGFGLGIVLVIGVGLGVQALRGRPLAH